MVDLFLKPDGTSVRNDVYAKERDVLDEVAVSAVGSNIYKSFITKMNELKSTGTVNDWEPIAYDWRLSLDEVLQKGHDIDGRIYYSGDLAATSTPYVIQELRRLAATSKTGKVTIVAHSNGGLVAKRLTQLLGSEASTLIDKMILVAVPQAGTPTALAVLMHGYGQDIGHGFIMSKSTARTFASTSPTTYSFLPSADYFTHVDDPLVSFDSSLPDWTARYGPEIHSLELLYVFLTESFGKVDAQTGDINQPIRGSTSLFSQATGVHETLDTWTPPSGVKLVQIAGWGVPTTVSGITYKKEGLKVAPDPQFTIDGDGTVVVPSALWTSTTTGVENYWVDFQKYNRDHNFSTGFGLFPFTHKDIFETDSVLNFVTDQVVLSIKPLADYTYLSTQPPAATGLRLRYALHSPLTLNLYDSEGHHTGVSTTTGQIEEQIPGTYYTELGDAKYIFSDASTDTRVVMNGYAAGTFTLNVDQFSGDTLDESTTFKDIPTTASTTVTLGTQSDISTLSPMSIDKNSDGTTDAVIDPVLGGVVTLDTTPPEIQLSFDTIAKQFTASTIDDRGDSSVNATTTYPAGRRGVATTTVTATDTTGNTTVLVYTEQLPARVFRDTATLQSLSYNGVTTTLTNKSLPARLGDVSMTYKWRTDRAGAYRLFSTFLRNAGTTLESHYVWRQNKTLVMGVPQDLDDRDVDDDVVTRPVRQTLAGMVVPYMTTRKGNLIISY